MSDKVLQKRIIFLIIDHSTAPRSRLLSDVGAGLAGSVDVSASDELGDGLGRFGKSGSQMIFQYVGWFNIFGKSVNKTGAFKVVGNCCILVHAKLCTTKS